MKAVLLLMVPLIFSLTVIAFMPISEAISPNVPEFARAHVITTSSSTSDNASEKNEHAEGKPDPRPKRP
jgi:hypothetical protein